MTYSGGEDLNALVVDLGESMFKVGFAGEDTPRFFQPAVAGYSENSIKKNLKRPDFVGSEAVDLPRKEMQLHSHITDGLWTDWDIVEHVLETSCEKALSVKMTDHPFLFSEPSFNTRPIREKLTELMFEKYEVPAFFLSKSAVLSCFANGRSTGLILDIGGGTTTVVPVHDGYALQKGLMRSQAGGRMLDKQLLAVLENKGLAIQPRFMTDLPQDPMQEDESGYHQSFLEYHKLDVVRNLKESVCRVSDAAFDEAANAQIPTVPYELPDGKTVEVGTERFGVPEVLFEPSLNLVLKDALTPEPLQKVLVDAAMACDLEVRRDLFHNMILTGGGSCFEGITVRLEREVAALAPPVFKTKVLAAHAPERRLGAWLGGSILGSLGSFTEMWISKAEFVEHGPTIVERKCP